MPRTLPPPRPTGPPLYSPTNTSPTRETSYAHRQKGAFKVVYSSHVYKKSETLAPTTMAPTPHSRKHSRRRGRDTASKAYSSQGNPQETAKRTTAPHESVQTENQTARFV